MASRLPLFEAYRDPEKVKVLLGKIYSLGEKIGRKIRIMEFCGGHTHSIMKYGIDTLLGDFVEFVHGPGCPVCVMPWKELTLPSGSLRGRR